MGLRAEWSRVIAHAWNDADFMEKLRQNPRTTLNDAAIREQLQLEKLGTDVSGYLPLPDKPDGLAQLKEEELEEFLEENGGIFGIMRFCCI